MYHKSSLATYYWQRGNPLKSFVMLSILEGGEGFRRCSLSQKSVDNKDLETLPVSVGGMIIRPCSQKPRKLIIDLRIIFQ
jgi:hypothetical protein